jgi:hypothetical protein
MVGGAGLTRDLPLDGLALTRLESRQGEQAVNGAAGFDPSVVEFGSIKGQAANPKSGHFSYVANLGASPAHQPGGQTRRSVPQTGQAPGADAAEPLSVSAALAPGRLSAQTLSATADRGGTSPVDRAHSAARVRTPGARVAAPQSAVAELSGDRTDKSLWQGPEIDAAKPRGDGYGGSEAEGDEPGFMSMSSGSGSALRLEHRPCDRSELAVRAGGVRQLRLEHVGYHDDRRELGGRQCQLHGDDRGRLDADHHGHGRAERLVEL